MWNILLTGFVIVCEVFPISNSWISYFWSIWQFCVSPVFRPFVLQLVFMEKIWRPNIQKFLTWEAAGDSSYPPPPPEVRKPAFFWRLLTCQTLLPLTLDWNKISIQTQRGHLKDNNASKKHYYLMVVRRCLRAVRVSRKWKKVDFFAYFVKTAFFKYEGALWGQ